MFLRRGDALVSTGGGDALRIRLYGRVETHCEYVSTLCRKLTCKGTKNMLNTQVLYNIMCGCALSCVPLGYF